MFELMIGAGLRVGEVAELKLTDLYPADQSGQARLRVRGKGDKDRITWLTAESLRHTLATFLVNQGMPITSWQKFLDHQNINKTLIYARVYDETVRHQFANAMAQIEAIAIADWPGQSYDPIHSIPTAQICNSVKIEVLKYDFYSWRFLSLSPSIAQNYVRLHQLSHQQN